MEYLFNHTVLFNGEFSPVVIGSIVLLIGTAVYCICRLNALKKKAEAAREDQILTETAEDGTKE